MNQKNFILNDHTIKFEAALWRYDGKAAWFFITIPKEASAWIRFVSTENRSAWGSVPVRVTIGGSDWQTSVFPDSKIGGYLLPVKAAIRKREGLEEGMQALVTLTLMG